MNRWSRPAGLAVLVWRFVLTTGTGSIFGFLVARQAYQSALLAPLFIVLSFGWGLAVFLGVQATLYAGNGRRLPADVQRRMARLLGIFVAASLYLVAVHHLTNLYFARQVGVRGVHPARARRWRRLRAAVLGRLRAGRLGGADGAAVPSAARRRTRHAGRGGAGRGRRLRLAVRLHHRRPGLPARHLPGLRGQQQLRGRCGRPRTCPSLARTAAGDRRRRRGLADHDGAACACSTSCRRTIPHSRRRSTDLGPPAHLRRAQVFGQDDDRARAVRGAGRARHPRAAVQEGPGLHRPDVARARRGPAVLQPRPLPDGRRGAGALLQRGRRAAPSWPWSRATRDSTTAWRWTAATATPPSPAGSACRCCW